MSRCTPVSVLILCALIAGACSGATPSRATAPLAAATGAPAMGAPAADPAPGLRLPRDLRPTGYRATVRIDPTETTFAGSIEIDAVLSRPSRTLWLHAHRLTIAQAFAIQGTRRIPLTTAVDGDDRLALRATVPLPAGVWTLAIDYRGLADEQQSAGVFRRKLEGQWYVFTQLEAISARRVFPSVDEPDSKVPWELTLEVPHGQTALANTRPLHEEPAGPGWKRIRFAQTRPLPSYLVAFAIGPFAIVDAGTSRTGVPLRVVATRGRARDTALAVDLLPDTLAFLEDALGMPYPFDKLDLVAMPTVVGFAAMEHPGLVTFDAQLLLFDPAAQTPADRDELGVVLAHELAHQWFGNIVTLAWWNDVWLNEGLATWIEHRALAAVDPRWDAAAGELDRRAAALASDGIVTARAVRQPVASQADILNSFDGITYAKAATVMAMIERWVGPERFVDGVRRYLARHAGGNATAEDFLTSIAEAAGRDLSWVSTFLDQAGVPLLHIDLVCDGGRAQLSVAQSRFRPAGTPAGTPQRWTMPVCVAYDRDGARAETCAVVDGERASVELEAKSCPAWVLPNADGVGYYRTALTPALVRSVLDRGWTAMTVRERASFADDLWRQVQLGEIPLADGVALVPRLLADGTRLSTDIATNLAEQRQHVPAARRAAYDRWIVKVFGPLARQLGWQRKASDGVDAEHIRKLIVGGVAVAGDPALRAQARTLAASWRTLSRDDRAFVLRVAAREPAVFDRLFKDLLAEPDRDRRHELLIGLSGTQDPQRIRRLFGLYLDHRIDTRELGFLPFLVREDAPREAAAAYVREHLAAIAERLPVSGMSRGITALAPLFAGACDASRRDKLAAYMTSTLVAAPHTRRWVDQAIERMDQCIAWRALAAPQLEAWLGKTR